MFLIFLVIIAIVALFMISSSKDKPVENQHNHKSKEVASQLNKEPTFGELCKAQEMQRKQDSNLGEDEVQYNLGEKYYLGDSVQQSFVTAAICFKEAAELGHTAAQHKLGGIIYIWPRREGRLQ